MGWCSGTIIFDGVVEALLYPEKSNPKEVIKKLVKTMWELDWDCEPDSDYFFHPLVKEVFCELDDSYIEYFREMEKCPKCGQSFQVADEVLKFPAITIPVCDECLKLAKERKLKYG